MFASNHVTPLGSACPEKISPDPYLDSNLVNSAFVTGRGFGATSTLLTLCGAGAGDGET
jgi:hypothetical protein